MKKIITFLLVVLFTIFTTKAQVPQGISYQAIAFNTQGTPITNGNVGIKISILDTSINGSVIYSETHTKTTNAQGLFNLNIGQGTPVIGVFSTVNWGFNSKFLKVEVDPTGGTSYTNVGVNQLMSVPYALFAENVANGSGSESIAEQIIESKSANIAFNDSDGDKVYVFNSKTGNWSSQSYKYISGTIKESKGNFMFNDSDDDIVYVFNSNTDSWSSQSYTYISGSIVVDTVKGNFLFNDSDGDIVYVFNSKTGNWSSQSYKYISGTIKESKGNFMFNDSDDDIVYVFNSNTDSWSSQSYKYINGSIQAINGNFYFNDSDDDVIYFFNAKTGNWTSQPYTYINGSIIISETD